MPKIAAVEMNMLCLGGSIDSFTLRAASMFSGKVGRLRTKMTALSLSALALSAILLAKLPPSLRFVRIILQRG